MFDSVHLSTQIFFFFNIVTLSIAVFSTSSGWNLQKVTFFVHFPSVSTKTDQAQKAILNTHLGNY